jgi:hypothetical protein
VLLVKRRRKPEWKVEIGSHPNEKEAFAKLGHSIVNGVKQCHRGIIAEVREGGANFLGYVPPTMGEHTGDVLHKRNSWTETPNEEEKTLVELVTRIPRRIHSAPSPAISSRRPAIAESPELAATDLAPTLAGRAASYNIENGLNLLFNHPGFQLVRPEARQVSEKCSEPMLGKVGFQRFDCERAVIYRDRALVAGPMEAERKASSSRKQVEHGRDGGVVS